MVSQAERDRILQNRGGGAAVVGPQGVILGIQFTQQIRFRDWISSKMPNGAYAIPTDVLKAMLEEAAHEYSNRKSRA